MYERAPESAYGHFYCTFGTAIVFCRFVCHFFIFLRCELDRNLRVDLDETSLGSRVLRGFSGYTRETVEDGTES